MTNLVCQDSKKNTRVLDPQNPGKHKIVVNGQELIVEVIDTSTMTEIDISKEEDGDISEWNGNTGSFSVTESPVVSDSSHNIKLTTGGNAKNIDVSYEEKQYLEFNFYVYPKSNTNSEIVFWDGKTSSALFCVYFREDSGIFYSSPINQTNKLSKIGSLGQRASGVELQSESNTSKQFYNIKIRPDYENETVNIVLDGSTVLSNQSFLESGTPNQCRLACNTGQSSANSYVDEIVAFE